MVSKVLFVSAAQEPRPPGLSAHAELNPRPQRGLADIKRLTPEVVTDQLDKVEGVQEHVAIMAPISNPVERCHPVLVTGDGLPVDDTGARAEMG
jgi:hypothetical protein